MQISILFIILGIVCIVATAKGWSYDKKTGYITGFYLFLFGSLFGCSILYDSEPMIAYVLGEGIGIMFLTVVGLEVKKKFTCSQRTEGEVCKWTIYSSKGASRYAPVFRYKWNGQIFECQSSFSFSKKIIIKKYEIGKYYPIYINKNKPMELIISNRIDFVTVLIFIIGCILCLFPFYNYPI